MTNAVSQAQQSEKEALRRLDQSAAAARLAVDQRKRTNAAAWTAAHSSGLGSSETPAARKAVLDAPVSTSESDSDAESGTASSEGSDLGALAAVDGRAPEARTKSLGAKRPRLAGPAAAAIGLAVAGAVDTGTSGAAWQSAADETPRMSFPLTDTCTLLLPVLVGGPHGGRPQPLVALPAGLRSVVGKLDSAVTPHTTKAHKAAVARAARWLPAVHGTQRLAHFLAGEVDTTGGPAKVVVVPTVALPAGATVVRTARRAQVVARSGGMAWFTLDAVASGPCKELYAIAAAALSRVESFIRPIQACTGPLRVGSFDATRFAGVSAWDSAGLGTSTRVRLERSMRANANLQRLLIQRAETDDGFGRFCATVADKVAGPDLSEIPESLLSLEVAFDPALEGLQDWKHRYVDVATPSAAERELTRTRMPPTFGEDPATIDWADPKEHTHVVLDSEGLPVLGDWWPHDATDVVRPWARRDAHDMMTLLTRHHRRRIGGHADAARPTARAYDERAQYPISRGRVWDFSRGPGKVVDAAAGPEPYVTHINRAFARDLFRDRRDREAVDAILHGVDFQCVVPPWSLLCPNLNSLYDGPGIDLAAAAAEEMRDLGWWRSSAWSHGGDFRPICWPLRSPARGTVEKAGAPRDAMGQPTELRPILDDGQPRKELWCLAPPAPPAGAPPPARLPWPTEPAQPPPSPVPSRNDVAQAMDDRVPELKPQFRDKKVNGAKLLSLADCVGWTVIEISWDQTKFFNQLITHRRRVWEQGAVTPAFDKVTRRATAALQFSLEGCMSMGNTESAGMAQRASDHSNCKLLEAFDAAEAPHMAALPEPLKRHMARLALRPHDGFGSQARLADCITYTDDPAAAVVVDPEDPVRAMRFLECVYYIYDGGGLRWMLNLRKLQIGTSVKWLGKRSATALGLVWVPRAKALRAVREIELALTSQMTAGAWRSMVGFLHSLLDCITRDPTFMHHLSSVMRAGGELERGTTTKVAPTEGHVRSLTRARGLLLSCAGSSMLTHVQPDAVGKHVASLIARSDAAVEGTPDPGLSGWLYERWWRYDMPEARRVHPQAIHEAVASGANLMMWEQETRHAPDVVLEADALATAQAHGLGRLKSEGMQLVVGRIFELQLSRKQMRAQHGNGEGNPLADAGSRGYFDVIEKLGAQLGLRVQRVPLTAEVLRWIEETYDALDRLLASTTWLRPAAGLAAAAMGVRGGAVRGAILAGMLQPGAAMSAATRGGAMPVSSAMAGWMAVAAVLLVVAAVTIITQRRRRGSDPPVVAPAPLVGYCTWCGAEWYECQNCGDTVHACDCEPTYCSCDAPRPPPAPPAACIPWRVATAASRGGASVLMVALLSAAAVCLACRGGGGGGGAVRVGVLVSMATLAESGRYSCCGSWMDDPDRCMANLEYLELLAEDSFDEEYLTMSDAPAWYDDPAFDGDHEAQLLRELDVFATSGVHDYDAGYELRQYNVDAQCGLEFAFHASFDTCPAAWVLRKLHMARMRRKAATAAALRAPGGHPPARPPPDGKGGGAFGRVPPSGGGVHPLMAPMVMGLAPYGMPPATRRRVHFPGAPLHQFGQRARAARRLARADPAAAGGTAYRFMEPDSSPSVAPVPAAGAARSTRAAPGPAKRTLCQDEAEPMVAPAQVRPRSQTATVGVAAEGQRSPQVAPQAVPAGMALRDPVAGRVEARMLLNAVGIRQRAGDLFDACSNDTSRWRVDCDQEELYEMCLSAAGDCVESGNSKLTTAYKYWTAYAAAKGFDPWRSDPQIAVVGSPAYMRELVLWANAPAWIYARMPPRRGWTTHPMPGSCMRNLRTVWKQFYSKGMAPPPLVIAVNKCNSMMDEWVKQNGAVLKHQMLPLTTKLIIDLLMCAGPRGWDWKSTYGVMWCAVIHTLAQTGFRKAEISLDAGVAFSLAHMSRFHLTWRLRDRAGRITDTPELTEHQANSLTVGCYAVLTPATSKADRFGMRWGAKPIFLPYHPTRAICAARALRDWELAFPVHGEARRRTPLFSDAQGGPLRRDPVHRLFREFMALVTGSEEEAKRYSMHSFRIYLCNALAAAGFDDKTIQAVLRWASADALLTYQLNGDAQQGAWLERAAESTFDVMRGGQVARCPDGRPVPRFEMDDIALALCEAAEEMAEIAADTGD